MKEIKLIVDGKEITFTPEQIEALGIDIDNGYDGCVCDKLKIGEVYFFINFCGEVQAMRHRNDCTDENSFSYGNYYRDESYAKQVALHQKLINLLRRYSEQHGGDNEWDGNNKHYMIWFNLSLNTYEVVCLYSVKEIGTVYFNSEKVAEQAIEEVVKPFVKKHPDFVW